MSTENTEVTAQQALTITEDTLPRYMRLVESLSRLKDAAINGEVDALHAYSILSAIESNVSDVTSELKAAALDAAKDQLQRESGETVYRGFKVTVRGGRKLWDYSHIPMHGKLKSELSALEKDAQAAYDASLRGVTHVDDNGEVKPAAVLKGVSESSLSIKLAK
jgi:hypothetical protein